MAAKMAYCLIRKEPCYRFDAFYAGLIECGFTVNLREPRYIKADDILLIWNRSGTMETLANCFESGGGTVVVAENGYVGKDEDGRQLYSLAISGHNGQGTWITNGPERWEELGIKLQSWREGGKYILVCPNRQIGPKEMRQPALWVDSVYDRLKYCQKLPIKVRPHPGNWQVRPPEIPLSADLEEAAITVIWSSSAGVHSLIAGVPVVCMAPKWICKKATTTDPCFTLPSSLLRRYELEKLAWAQWTVREIQSGKAFKWLLNLK